MHHCADLCIDILQNSPEVEVSSKQFVPTTTIFQFLAVCELEVLSCETECDSCEISYLSLHRQHPKLRQSAK